MSDSSPTGLDDADQPNVTGGIYAELVAWGAELPLWQNEIIRRLARGEELSDENISAISTEALKEAEQQSVAFQRLKASDFPSLAQIEEPVALRAVGSLRNVNALLTDQTLSFGPQLTVIYGANASGKSGYARVLKRVFRARVKDEILHDLRSQDPPGVPSARIVVQTEGKPEEVIDWSDGVDLPPSFARFSVLDGHCCRAYIEGNSELMIAPEGLDIPERAARVIDRVKLHLSEKATEARPKKEDLAELENDTPSGLFVRSLSAATAAAEIDARCAFDAADQKTLDDLGTRIDEQRRTAPDIMRAGLKKERSNIRALLEYARRVAESVSDAVISDLRCSAEEHDRALDVAQTVRASILDPQVPTHAIGGDPWRRLISSAAAFVSESTTGQGPTLAVNDQCALCWQPLDNDARERLTRFHDYLVSEAEKSLQAAQQRLDHLTAPLREQTGDVPDATSTLAANISADVEHGLRKAVASAGTRAKLILDALRRKAWADLPVSTCTVVESLEALDKDAATRELAIADDKAASAELAKLTRDHAELQTRRLLAERGDDVRGFVRSLIESQRYDAVAQAVNTRVVSAKAEQLERKYRTAEYEARFLQELRDNLRFARPLPVFHKRVSKAKTLISPVISARFKNIKTAEVFSEGEQTAMSLAAFLAEVGITGDTAGLIFDDPISSLDHNVRARVADRLVREAKQRQVIVLTHDLAFFADLRAEAKIQGVDVSASTLIADEWSTGFVESEMPFGARSVSQRTKVLRQLVLDVAAAGKAGERAKARSLTRSFYDRLRSTWERFVEEKMFAGTVQRLERNVSPGNLLNAVVTDEIITNVQQSYKRCSEMIEAHDHTPGDGTQPAGTSDMTADLDLLERTGSLVKAELTRRGR